MIALVTIPGEGSGGHVINILGRPHSSHASDATGGVLVPEYSRLLGKVDYTHVWMGVGNPGRFISRQGSDGNLA